MEVPDESLCMGSKAENGLRLFYTDSSRQFSLSLAADTQGLKTDSEWRDQVRFEKLEFDGRAGSSSMLRTERAGPASIYFLEGFERGKARIRREGYIVIDSHCSKFIEVSKDKLQPDGMSSDAELLRFVSGIRFDVNAKGLAASSDNPVYSYGGLSFILPAGWSCGKPEERRIYLANENTPKQNRILIGFPESFPDPSTTANEAISTIRKNLALCAKELQQGSEIRTRQVGPIRILYVVGVQATDNLGRVLRKDGYLIGKTSCARFVETSRADTHPSISPLDPLVPSLNLE